MLGTGTFRGCHFEEVAPLPPVYSTARRGGGDLHAARRVGGSGDLGQHRRPAGGPEERDAAQALQPPDHSAYRDDPEVRHILALTANMVLEAVAQLLRSEGQ